MHTQKQRSLILQKGKHCTKKKGPLILSLPFPPFYTHSWGGGRGGEGCKTKLAQQIQEIVKASN